MQSPDWPDLPYVQARSYGVGRSGRQIKYSVIHYTAGSERATAAEDGAAYDQRRLDGVSTHYFHDRDSTIQCVRLADRANAAFHKGNRLGIQHELCGTVQTRDQWLDAASYPTLQRAAFQVARDHLKFGLPVRRLSVAQVRACWYEDGPGGICGHVDVTNAYPEDGGTHTDPGAAFPWDVFMQLVVDYYEGDDDMEQTEDLISPFARPGQTVGDVLADMGTRRDWDYDEPGGEDSFNPPAPTSRIAVLHANVAELVARPPAGTPSQDQVTAAMKAALLDPEVLAALKAIAFEGAQQAERQ